MYKEKLGERHAHKTFFFCSCVTVMLSIISRWMAKKNHGRGQNTSEGTYKRDLHSKPKWETDTQDLSIFVLLPRWFCPHFLEVRQTNAMHIKRGLNTSHAYACHAIWNAFQPHAIHTKDIKYILHTSKTFYIPGIDPKDIKDILHTGNRSQRHERHATYLQYILMTSKTSQRHQRHPAYKE